jgi:hypothetical protein
MKINLQNKVGDDVRRLTSNPQAGGRSVPVPGRSKIGITSGMDFSSSAQKPTLLRPGRAYSERGIALVITLILLSVTLVMAIAFLAISRREAGSVSTSTDSVTARYAADAALANAQAQIIASVLATADPYSSGLLVSTNFINAYGFKNSGAGIADPTNVNYAYGNGNPLNSVADFDQNVANLLYLPRAPVFVPNPTNSSAPSDFRFYLDLNRNGQFETNGVVTNVDSANKVIFAGGNPVVNNQVGDPEWVGVLERPDVPHGPNNKFVARYAFVAVPADGSLDLNAIHNQAKSTTAMNFANDGYFRNQGVGSWEINLAAFLADLNTNQWETTAAPYSYRQGKALPFPNTGFAFEDALAMLSWRYANNYNSLASLQQVLGAPGYTAYASGIIDSYTAGNLMTNTRPPFLNLQNTTTSWAGADNTNHYFSISSDLFDTTKITPTNFINHLEQAGNGVSTYDRYTYYRMLAQLGTDSAPAENQVNLNYSNAVATFNANGVLTGVTYFPNAQTNLMPWQPLQFFTITADRLLREYSTTWFQSDPSNYLFTYYGLALTNIDGSGYGVTNVSGFRMTNQVPSFSITNIPVLANGQFVYTPAVQRVLQLAANIYDATTNQTAFLGKDYPSVFRPILYKSIIGFVTNVTIVGYQYIASVTSASSGQYRYPPPLDPPDPILGNVYSLKTGYTPPNPKVTTDPYGNVWGVPWIIGAKKGLPNFNEFSMQDVVKVTRKLQVTRPNTNSLPTITNQMYVVSVTNSMGVEFWNSYTNGYTNTLQQMQVVVNDNLSMRMELTNGNVLFADGKTMSQNIPLGARIDFNVWPASAFLIPYGTNFTILPDSAYSFPFTQFYNVAGNPNPTFQATTPTFAPLPQILLQVTNYLQAFIVENNHVIDYVHFTGPGSSRNLTAEFQNTNTTAVGSGTGPYYTNLVWSMALDNTGLPLGITEQIAISAGSIDLNTVFWKDPNAKIEIDGFRHFLNPALASKYGTTSGFMYSTNLAVQAPYTPTAITYEYNTYQANDPLVHYLKSDLNYLGYDPDNNSPLETGIHPEPLNIANFPLLPNLGKVNARYQPWGKIAPNGQAGVSQATYDENAYNLAFKDPLMKQSDNWDFPTNKLPTVGWLGRVHRGTPWQTVYLKASDILAELNPVNPNLGNVGTNTWAIWTGNLNISDAVLTAPINDRQLVGWLVPLMDTNVPEQLLSVNASRLTDWSTLLGGMVVFTNSTQFPQFKQFQPLTNGMLTIDPSDPVVGQLVTAINTMRAQFNNADGLVGTFENVGDILSVPQLTEQSPFLNWNNANQQQNGISDEVYEVIPAQLLPLLRPDSVGKIIQANGGWNIQFSGSDGFDYGLQTSMNLVNWNSVGTFHPVQGYFSLPISPASNSQKQFYRSMLLP